MTDYAELHAHSNFSFLDGAAHPEQLVSEAARLGLSGLALTDHDGLYGVVRFAEAARQHNLSTIFGAELTLGLKRRQNGVADPEGSHLVVLAKDPRGYGALSEAIGEAQLSGGGKGRPYFCLEDLASAQQGHWLVLTGCRKGAVPSALVEHGPAAAARALDGLISAFGRDQVVVELWRHEDPLDFARNDVLAELAATRKLGIVATTNAHYARPDGHRLAGALAAVRARRSLEEMQGWLPPSPSAHLRSAVEQQRRFSRYPGAVELAGELGKECAFDLRLVAPGLPPFPCPDGLDEMGYLRVLVDKGAEARYGPRGLSSARAWRQLEHELSVIEALGFPGYFLVVWDIVRFCQEHDIYCQGRGSAANSAVCYALSITNADAVALGLLFERFLSTERDGPPDIDIDIESGRREEVIQYVYERHGRRHAAQVANVITYRSRSAIKDAGRALGYPISTIERWSTRVEGHRRVGALGQEKDRHGKPVHEIPSEVLALAEQLEDFPRHLGVHSGGMVMCDRPIAQVCPVEWATAPGRTVLQWDKEDCAAIGLVKFDLLGLGMLEALHRCIDLVRSYHKVPISLANIPAEDPAVYEMLTTADTVGVFQVESRAQMGTLPRLKPRCFYDLVVEVALIRPGPIQGGSVHPYLRRRNGEEEVSYLHPLLKPCLERTLGVPLFQEQLMQMAIDVAGFCPAEADQLRQAMGSKRSVERMEALRGRFYAGMKKHHITGQVADAIWEKMAAFSNFGFPESHAVSFASLVYASAFLKRYYPAAFLASLLNSQPMGFWSPRSLIADARRHGVVVFRPEVNKSAAKARLEAHVDPARPAVRLGLCSVRGLGEGPAETIAKQAPYVDFEDLARRTGLSEAQLEALSTAGALEEVVPGGRRAALWAAGVVARCRPGQFPGMTFGGKAPPLPEMGEKETLLADLWATGVSVDRSLIELVRSELDERGVVPAARLRGLCSGTKVTVAGLVTHRQRPGTARGITFVNLEDETGLVNVICSIGVWTRYRKVAQSASAMIVSGRLEAKDGVVNVVAERIEALELAMSIPSRDFS